MLSGKVIILTLIEKIHMLILVWETAQFSLEKVRDMRAGQVLNMNICLTASFVVNEFVTNFI